MLVVDIKGTIPGFNANNIKVVRPNQTVQQVLDSINDASENNRYLVLVPSGHETEYFDWKPYVEVRFLDNLDEKWQLDELTGWDDLSNWSIGSVAAPSIEEVRGEKVLKLSIVDSGAPADNYFFLTEKDLRKYQGLVFTIEFENKSTSQSITFPFFTYDINGSYIRNTYGYNTGVGKHRRTLFIPFNYDTDSLANVDGMFQWDAVEKFRIPIYGVEAGDTVLLSNFKLVRTFPYPCLLIRTDDSYLGNNGNRVKVLHELERKQLPAIWAIIARDISWSGYSEELPTPEMLQEFQGRGLISIVNHSFSHPDFYSDLQDDEKGTLFEVEASTYIFERLGLKDALRWWVNPYGNTNAYLSKHLREFGYISLYNCHDVVPLCISTPGQFLSQTYGLKKGGICTYLFHDYNCNTDEDMQNLLDEIDNILQTHRPISIRDVEKLISNSHEKSTSRQTEPTLFEVLDSDFNLYFYHKQVFLDPNGTDRYIFVKTDMMRPGDTFLISNVGTSGSLIFDPTGMNITIAPSATVRVVYTG